MNTASPLIYASPNKKMYQASAKQTAWRKRVQVLWRLKGICLNFNNDVTTKEEREKLAKAKSIIDEILREFSDNNVKLGFKSKK